MIREYDSFRIAGSMNIDDLITEVSPDIAVCPECLSEMDSFARRKDYPLINCTCCGPRFSIMEALPYDRPMTSMKSFMMCPDCRREYDDIMDRRFHAQPAACNLCGPEYFYSDSSRDISGTGAVLKETAKQINSGNILAIKGTGGYHLMCDALNEAAVRRLRLRKQRDAKPFAVMFRDIESLKEYCRLSAEESEELISWRRPVMILDQIKPLAPSVSSGLNTTGAMLPYMPFHYLIFRLIDTPAVVLTSGNLSEEPVIKEDTAAAEKLGKISDGLVCYNREIVNRCDDSVVRVIDHKLTLIRRSRGYVPRPVDLRINAEGILALGAEQKSTFCMGRGNQAILSQYIGDIKNQATFDFLKESVDRFSGLFRFRPTALACDLHPDYLSTQYAKELSRETGLPLFTIQHHHAHIVSCMAENGLDEPVIGVSFDGTGYGSDGTVWGGEFLVADLKDFSRHTYLDPVALPGGDKAISEPWRTAFSYLFRYFGSSFDFMSVPSLCKAGERKLYMLLEMLEKNINCPVSSGAGRLFDAVSALLGLCTTETFDSEAPMRLESAIDGKTDDYYSFTAGKPVTFEETFRSLLDDIKTRTPSHISARFHNTLAMVILEVSLQIRRENSIKKVVLSGGCFQNRYLLERACNLLRKKNFVVYTNRRVPPNDGGISLGQLVAASKLRE
jgi:hydrogenase maturation protein HypF